MEESHIKSKQKPMKIEDKNFPSLPGGPPPKTAAQSQRKPIFEMLDDGIEESKNAPAYDPFSGGAGP